MQFYHKYAVGAMKIGRARHLADIGLVRQNTGLKPNILLLEMSNKKNFTTR